MASLEFSAEAMRQLEGLRADNGLKVRRKAVEKALGFLQQNPKHQSLNTHQYKGVDCPHGDKLWEAYAQNKTPGAYRIFFCYLRDKPDTIYIVAITPHP